MSRARLLSSEKHRALTRSLVTIALLFALACGDTAAPVSTLPAVPAVPIATPRTGEIVVSWQDLSDNETGFRVEVRTSDGPWLLLRETAANTTNVTHPNVLHSVQYFYRIAACNDLGCSEFVETSAKWQTGAPPVVTSLLITQLRADNASFRASVRTGGLDTHITFVYRPAGVPMGTQIGPITIRGSSQGEDGAQQVGFATASAFGLRPETDYTVSVFAANLVGSALTGDPVAFRTRPLEPVVYDDFRVVFWPPNIVQVQVVVDQLGLEVEGIAEVARVGDDFDQPVAVQTVTLPARLGTHIMVMSFREMEPGKDYKARMTLRNANGIVITPVRTFRAQ